MWRLHHSDHGRPMKSLSRSSRNSTKREQSRSSQGMSAPARVVFRLTKFPTIKSPLRSPPSPPVEASKKSTTRDCQSQNRCLHLVRGQSSNSMQDIKPCLHLKLLSLGTLPGGRNLGSPRSVKSVIQSRSFKLGGTLTSFRRISCALWLKIKVVTLMFEPAVG